MILNVFITHGIMHWATSAFFCLVYFCSMSALMFIHICFNVYTFPYSEAATRVVLGKKVVLRNFAKFAGKHLCQGLCILTWAISI